MIDILIVHSCPLFRVGLRSCLEQHDDCHLVGEATHLKDVLSLVRVGHPDVVLLDGGLTWADPLEMTRQLRKAGVPSILVFAPPEGDEEMLFQFVKHGAAAFESGTLSGEDLVAKVRKMYDGEYLVNGDVLVTQAARRKRLAHMRQDGPSVSRSCAVELAKRTSAQQHPCPVPGPVSPLSRQEQDILEQFAKGCGTTAQVAQRLGISAHLAKHRIGHLLRTCAVSNRTAAVVMALRHQWIAVD